MSNITQPGLATTNPARLIQSFYDALGRGDVPCALALLDPQVQWTEAERFPYYGGTWIGPQAVLDNLLKRLAEDWSEFSAKAGDFIVEGSRVVAFGQYAGTYKRTGKSMTAPVRAPVVSSRRQARKLPDVRRHGQGTGSPLSLSTRDCYLAFTKPGRARRWRDLSYNEAGI